MNIFSILETQTNRELAALRRSGASDYAVRSEAVRSFQTRLKNFFIQHPEDAHGIFGSDLELPSSQFENIMEKCRVALRDNDDARFSLYDLMDAVGHASFDLDIAKLLALSDRDFYEVVTAMADAKRRTYCSDSSVNPNAYTTADDLDALIRLHDLQDKHKK